MDDRDRRFGTGIFEFAKRRPEQLQASWFWRRSTRDERPISPAILGACGRLLEQCPQRSPRMISERAKLDSGLWHNLLHRMTDFHSRV